MMTWRLDLWLDSPSVATSAGEQQCPTLHQFVSLVYEGAHFD
jgi:hypothetical protein